MIKRISLVARKPGMTREAFLEHWMGPHVEIVRTLPGLRGLQLNIIAEGGEGGWDGIGELWFDSIDAARQAFAAEPVAGMLAADRPQFLGLNEVYFVAEHAVIPPPRERDRS